MFDQILGLPAHPLIVHFAVVLTPLLVLAAAAYALVPRVRTPAAWAVVLLAVAAPVAVFAAKESGESLKRARFAEVEGPLGARVAAHESYASPLLLSAAGLAAVTLALVYATTPGRGSLTSDRFGRPVTIVLSALTVVLAAVAGYFCFRAGDSGARAVWASAGMTPLHGV
ncbi:DUF2231 domain-containing protein [Nonomuraea spiralis]|uniref:DUF2231 domain-containing protein n=1 Tax=Nonomuraea spiralis TaxID=46182 RepID=A0ABV5IMN5_9ACTN|nr:DUF2231 domain-containing protein [Nonomuraea spiralis]GGT23357.1 hypothetical protein GCM10010176_079890 [Nonomuraea spiralis]